MLEQATTLLKMEKARIKPHEVSSEEMLKQLQEKIDRDFDKVKNILGSLEIMDSQLQEIEDS